MEKKEKEEKKCYQDPLRQDPEERSNWLLIRSRLRAGSR